MEAISVFDIFKIGVGPSSSHTIGPWRAAARFLETCRVAGSLGRIERISVDLFGSVAKTGRGHGTDFAVLLGLMGEDPETCDTSAIGAKVERVRRENMLRLGDEHSIGFEIDRDLQFRMLETLPFHPNGMRLRAETREGSEIERTYYSIGGGFIIQESEAVEGSRAARLPFPIESAAELLSHCSSSGLRIPEIVYRNELTWRDERQIDEGLRRISKTMTECILRGCKTEGVLPGGLSVVRRAPMLCRRLLGGPPPVDAHAFIAAIRGSRRDFESILEWISMFALAVNEENASFGRVVTAPTNGAAGVIPAVLMYDRVFNGCDDRGVAEFLMTAGELGSLFKKGATISAAMGGCQAEIGVSSAMAAGALCGRNGGSTEQILQAAEIAMEHHLGMTCDPVGGLVQIPCIERNSMGAIKAITAAKLALAGNPAHARVSLDAVIRSMWATALDMNTKYKETSEGGLAVQISVNVSEC
jgi:L-serine dehydratase